MKARRFYHVFVDGGYWATVKARNVEACVERFRPLAHRELRVLASPESSTSVRPSCKVTKY